MVEINDDKLRLRETVVDNVFPWFWQTQDNGAWQGPHEEWPQFKALYFKHLKGRQVCVQAGGNQGLYPRLFSDMFDHVYTFEPDFENFRCLVLNCHRPNIYKFNAALGDVHKMIHLNANSRENTGTHSIDPHQANEAGYIPQLRIDDFDFHACDMIQLDVEGYEIYALHGAVNTIKKFKPLIALEGCRETHKEFLATFRYEVVETCNADTILAVK